MRVFHIWTGTAFLVLKENWVSLSGVWFISPGSSFGCTIESCGSIVGLCDG